MDKQVGGDIDTRLYSAIADILTGKAHLKHSQNVQVKAEFGKGRMAMKLLDTGHQMEAKKRK